MFKQLGTTLKNQQQHARKPHHIQSSQIPVSNVLLNPPQRDDPFDRQLVSLLPHEATESLSPKLGSGTSCHQFLRARFFFSTNPAQCKQEASYAKFGLDRMSRRWNAAIFIACNSCLFRRANHSFQHVNFSILNPMRRDSLTTACSYLVMIPVIAHYGLSDAPELLFTGSFLHHCSDTLTT